MRTIRCLLLLLTWILGASALFADVVRVEVDARDATRRIFHTRMLVPVQPGPATLVYPKWFPGTHAPTGQIADLTGLRIRAAGKDIPWIRDEVDMFAFHCNAPADAKELEVTFDFVVPTEHQAEHHPSAASEYSGMISWTSLLLYPAGTRVDQLMYSPALRLPDGWKYGTALKATGESAAGIEFAPVSLYTLVDSPVVAGAHFRTIDLSPGSEVPFLMHIAADSEADLAMKPETVAAYRNLIREIMALFGARHFTQYHFLLTLSDPLQGGAVEHHECSDNRAPERMFLDEDPFRYWADTLPHEMTHSWVGKYRRPAGLDTRDYQEPARGQLLWVYEGLTNYLGYVLAARSGLLTGEEFRDATAWVAAVEDVRPGRTWRPLLDTTAGVSATINASSEWSMWRRARDYYNEGNLLWLEADTIIRRQTGGRASLDDFCRSFFGGKSGSPEVKPFTLDELLAALNAVAPYDWKQFFEERINRVSTHAPLGGIEAGGWRLAYGEKGTPYFEAVANSDKVIDLRYSLGLILKEDGSIQDVLPGSAGAAAGVAPGMKLLGVNGRHWSKTQILEAVAASKTATTPLELLVENGDFYRILKADYHGGAKFPFLQRIEGSEDTLSRIIAPLVPPPAPAK